MSLDKEYKRLTDLFYSLQKQGLKKLYGDVPYSFYLYSDKIKAIKKYNMLGCLGMHYIDSKWLTASDKMRKNMVLKSLLYLLQDVNYNNYIFHVATVFPYEKEYQIFTPDQMSKLPQSKYKALIRKYKEFYDF